MSHDGGIPFERKQVTSLNMSTVQLVSPNGMLFAFVVGQANGAETSDLVDTRKSLLGFRKEDWPFCVRSE